MKQLKTLSLFITAVVSNSRYRGWLVGWLVTALTNPRAQLSLLVLTNKRVICSIKVAVANILNTKSFCAVKILQVSKQFFMKSTDQIELKPGKPILDFKYSQQELMMHN